jgi:hypothetical protein
MSDQWHCRRVIFGDKVQITMVDSNKQQSEITDCCHYNEKILTLCRFASWTSSLLYKSFPMTLLFPVRRPIRIQGFSDSNVRRNTVYGRWTSL